MSAAAATFGAAVAGGAINALSQMHTNASNREQAQYAFGQQMAAIHEQNVYNSPGQQVLRMKAAGLNPSLAYGADGAMVGNQADVPAYNAIPAEAPNIGNMGAAMSDAIRTSIDVEDLEIRKDLATAEIACKDAQSFLAVTSGELNLAQKQQIMTLLGYQVEKLESETQLNWENVLKSRQEIANLKAQKQEILSRIGVNEEQMKLLAAQTGLTEMQCYRLVQLLPHEIALMDAETALATMNANLSQEEMLKLDADLRHIGFVERLEREQFDFEKGKFEVEARKWEKEYRANRVENFTDNLIRIYTFGLGASALRNGYSLPPVRRSGSHHGTTFSNHSNGPSTYTHTSGKDRYKEKVRNITGSR